MKSNKDPKCRRDSSDPSEILKICASNLTHRVPYTKMLDPGYHNRPQVQTVSDRKRHQKIAAARAREEEILSNWGKTFWNINSKVCLGLGDYISSCDGSEAPCCVDADVISLAAESQIPRVQLNSTETQTSFYFPSQAQGESVNMIDKDPHSTITCNSEQITTTDSSPHIVIHNTSEQIQDPSVYQQSPTKQLLSSIMIDALSFNDDMRSSSFEDTLRDCSLEIDTLIANLQKEIIFEKQVTESLPEFNRQLFRSAISSPVLSYTPTLPGPKTNSSSLLSGNHVVGLFASPSNHSSPSFSKFILNSPAKLTGGAGMDLMGSNCTRSEPIGRLGKGKDTETVSTDYISYVSRNSSFASRYYSAADVLKSSENYSATYVHRSVEDWVNANSTTIIDQSRSISPQSTPTNWDSISQEQEPFRSVLESKSTIDKATNSRKLTKASSSRKQSRDSSQLAIDTISKPENPVFSSVASINRSTSSARLSKYPSAYSTYHSSVSALRQKSSVSKSASWCSNTYDQPSTAPKAFTHRRNQEFITESNKLSKTQEEEFLAEQNSNTALVPRDDKAAITGKPGRYSFHSMPASPASAFRPKHSFGSHGAIASRTIKTPPSLEPSREQTQSVINTSKPITAANTNRSAKLVKCASANSKISYDCSSSASPKEFFISKSASWSSTAPKTFTRKQTLAFLPGPIQHKTTLPETHEESLVEENANPAAGIPRDNKAANIRILGHHSFNSVPSSPSSAFQPKYSFGSHGAIATQKSQKSKLSRPNFDNTENTSQNAEISDYNSEQSIFAGSSVDISNFKPHPGFNGMGPCEPVAPQSSLGTTSPTKCLSLSENPKEPISEMNVGDIVSQNRTKSPYFSQSPSEIMLKEMKESKSEMQDLSISPVLGLSSVQNQQEMLVSAISCNEPMDSTSISKYAIHSSPENSQSIYCPHASVRDKAEIIQMNQIPIAQNHSELQVQQSDFNIEIMYLQKKNKSLHKAATNVEGTVDEMKSGLIKLRSDNASLYPRLAVAMKTIKEMQCVTAVLTTQKIAKKISIADPPVLEMTQNNISRIAIEYMKYSQGNLF